MEYTGREILLKNGRACVIRRAASGTGLMLLAEVDGTYADFLFMVKRLD